jgi:hypothetical protein
VRFEQAKEDRITQLLLIAAGTAFAWLVILLNRYEVPAWMKELDCMIFQFTSKNIPKYTGKSLYKPTRTDNTK